MDKLFLAAVSSLMGGFVQAVAGFGGAVIIMIFLPSILSMNAAPAVSDAITMMLSFTMCWRYRKYVNFRKILFPACFYLLASTFVIRQSAFWDSGKLKMVFGCFLVILSLYFIWDSGNVSIRPSVGMSILCAALSGICGGLFGISGPPASLYYLSSTKTKEEYLGSLNAFFSVGVIFNMISRIANGFITTDLFPMIGIGIVAILAGCAAGTRISHRIALPVMKKCVYALMLFAGLVTIFL